MPDCCRRSVVFVAVLSLLCALPALGAPRKGKVVRVPKDVKDLPTAIRQVKEGGVIELAHGTYNAPAGGFSITNLGKAFTIRGAANGFAILDGRGAGKILTSKNRKRVTFERIVFQNGFGKNDVVAGGVTLTGAVARFVNCKFLNNVAGTGTGGGAVRALSGSDATFVRTEFRGNTSLIRGGAVDNIASTVTVEGGSFVENRTNPPGHRPNSTGGAIYVLDGILRVSDARFERNQAGFVGGAVYAFGTWTEPLNVPRADLTVVRSTFLENVACCGRPDTQGGAFHVENQTTLRLQNSQLLANRAQGGGAIHSYRAVVEVTGSLFQWNQALQGTTLGGGGAIFATSNEDVRDTVNRPSAVVTIADSMLQGGTGQPAAHSGGCLLAGGDASRAFGENGVVQMGTAAENRARVEVRRTVFADCDVQRSGVTGGFGGGLQVNLAQFFMEDSMVVDSDARGEGGGGGGVSILGETEATVFRTTFARNSADRGGALNVGGSTVLVSQSRFFGNDVRLGVRESQNESRGAALFTIPFRPEAKPERWRNVSGLVVDSLFSENVGIAVYDGQVQNGPVNEMRYNNNQFFETSFSDKVYVDSRLAPAGLNVAGLNQTHKSEVDNTRLFSAPSVGTLRAAPSVVGTGAPASANTFLHFAWTGRAATLDGQPLAARAGIVPAGPGAHALVVDGQPAGSITLRPRTCANGAACLAANRFQVRVQGARLVAGEADTAFFSLPGGETLAIQVLDQRDKNSHFWVVQGVSNLSGVSDLSGHTLEITDTETGTTRSWALSSATEVDSVAFPDI